MSRIKLLLNVLNDMRSLADSLEAMANAMADGDNLPQEQETKQTPAKEISPAAEQTSAKKTTVTHEMLRELAVKLSRSGRREEIKQLISKYGVKNITAVAESDLDAFYADLQQMGVS